MFNYESPMRRFAFFSSVPSIATSTTRVAEGVCQLQNIRFGGRVEAPARLHARPTQKIAEWVCRKKHEKDCSPVNRTCFP
jgi:hypothetical protein